MRLTLILGPAAGRHLTQISEDPARIGPGPVASAAVARGRGVAAWPHPTTTRPRPPGPRPGDRHAPRPERAARPRGRADPDRKSTRLNSSHITNSYAVFCLKKKKK